MAEVFLSYSLKDQSFVRQIHDALAIAGRDLWIDWRSIPDGSNWKNEIFSGIDAADNFVFIISPDSVASSMCREEVARAASSGKRIITILYRHVDSKLLPHPLPEIQWISYERFGFDETLQRLLSAIDSDLNWVHEHTRLLIRSEEWKREKYDESLLLRGRELQAALQWLAHVGSVSTPKVLHQQTAFILESQRTETRHQRRLVTALTVVFFVVATIAGVAWWQRNVSIMQRQLAVSRQLLAEAELIRTQSPSQIDAGALLAIESSRRAPTPDASQVLREILGLLPRWRMTLPLHADLGFVAFSADGNYMVMVARPSLVLATTLGGDRNAYLWDVSAGRMLPPLRHGSVVMTAAFTPDARRLITGSCDGTARVWDIASAREILRLRHGNCVTAVTATRSGDLLVSASLDRTVRLWDGRTGHEVKHFNALDGVYGLELSASNDYLAVASAPRATAAAEGTRSLLDYFSKRFPQPFVGNLAWFDTRPGAAEVWDLRTGQRLSVVQHHGLIGSAAAISSDSHILQFSQDGRLLLTALGDDTARLWDFKTGREVMQVKHEDYISSAVLSDATDVLVTGAWDRTARVWQVPSGREVTRVSLGDAGVDVAYNSKRSEFAVAGRDRTVRVFESRTGFETLRMSFRDVPRAVTFSPDGWRLGVGSAGGAAVASTQSGADSRTLWHKGEVSAIALNRNGHTLATVSGRTSLDSAGRQIDLWDIDTGAHLASVVHSDAISSFAFSPNGRFFASGANNGVARIIDLSNLTVTEFVGKGQVKSIAFSADGNYISLEVTGRSINA